MNNIEILEGLYASHQKKSKLNNEEKRSVKDILREILEKENYDDNEMNFFVLFPEDIGMNTVVDYLKSQKNTKLNMEIIDRILSCNEFKSNISGRSLNRSSYLLGKLYKEKMYTKTNELLNVIIELSLDNKTRKISDKTIEVLRKNIVYYFFEDLLFKTPDKISDETYYKFENVLLKVVFKDIKGSRCINKIQLELLNWIANSERKVVLSNDDKQEINNSIKLWPIEMINVVNDNVKIKEKFISQLNFDLNNKENEVEKITQDDFNQKEEHKSEKVHKVNCIVKEEGKTQSLIEILQLSLEKARNQVNNEALLKKSIDEISRAKVLVEQNYEEKLKESKRLESVISDLRDRLATVEQNNETLNNKVKVLNEMNDKLSKNIEHKNKELDTILQIESKEENVQIMEYKNKLSSKLRFIYCDFKDVEDRSMSIDFGENLRLQMKEIFDILLRSDIKL